MRTWEGIYKREGTKIYILDILERGNIKIREGENKRVGGEGILEEIMTMNFSEMNKESLQRHSES